MEILIQYGITDALDEDEPHIKEIQKWLTDEPIVIYNSGEYEQLPNGTYTINLFILHDHPENFIDLKIYLPTLVDEGNFIEVKALPDPTFGGLLEYEFEQ